MIANLFLDDLDITVLIVWIMKNAFYFLIYNF